MGYFRPGHRTSSMAARCWRVLLHGLLCAVAVQCQLVINLSSVRDSPMSILAFCVGCKEPDKEGSIVMGLRTRFGVTSFSVTGELVYCVPNHIENARLFNSGSLDNHIAIAERGRVSLYEKIMKIQGQSKALAVILADDGSCDDEFLYCGLKAGSAADGFAAFDDEELWRSVDIPVVVISQLSAKRLRSMMNVEQVKMKNLGMQFVSPTKQSKLRKMNKQDL